jgi:hypothetical protein
VQRRTAYVELILPLLYIFMILQICITGSTSASLHQILPWLYYHKVIGVSHFILFVEGEAAKPAVTSVLESIRVINLHVLLLFDLF